MSETRGPKEVAFDTHIRPLLDDIKARCKEHGVNFAAYFALDEIMPNVVLQSRMAQVNDETDFPGMQCVLGIWDVIMDGEKNFEESVATEGDGN